MTKYWQWLTNFLGKHPHVILVYCSVLVLMLWVYVRVVWIVTRDYVRCIGSQQRMGNEQAVSVTTVIEREEGSWSREVIPVTIF